MKKFEFKTISDDLLQEGITTELLLQVQDSGKMSPAIMTPGGEPVTLVKANPESFWLQQEDGSFLLDKNKKLQKFDLETCIIARARYWLLFSDQEIEKDNQRREMLKEKELQAEVGFIKRNLTEKVKKIQAQFKRVEMWAYNSQRSVEVVIQQNVDPDGAKYKQETALAWINEHPEGREFVDQITREYEAGDFDSLYIRLEGDGIPLLFTTQLDDTMGMEVVKKIFSADKIDNTIRQIAGRSHIESVAIMNIERRYAQVSPQKETQL